MDENKQYLQLFFAEAAEYLQILNDNVLELEQNPGSQENLINPMFRAAHSLKGMAATMGFKVLTDLTHKLENILDQVRNKSLIIEGTLINLLFTGLDYISQLLEQIKEKGEESLELEEYFKQLDEFLLNGHKNEEENNKSSLDLSLEDKKNLKANLKETDVVYKVKGYLEADSVYKEVRGFMFIKKAKELGYIIKSYPSEDSFEEDLKIGNSVSLIMVSSLLVEDIKMELEDIIDIKKVEIKEMNIEISNNNSSKKNLFQVSSTVRVDIEKLDDLMNMVGELLINKTRLEALEVDLGNYRDVIAQLDRVTMELHHIVMQIRMVPIGTIFNRFPRMIRDLSQEMKKKINFVIKGEETELDRSIIDQLTDPLIHLLRNSIDHGIEQAVIREKKEKAETGTIVLNAYQKGNEIIIEIEDDGQGIDLDKLLDKAISKNIISQEESENMAKRDKLNLIFASGLSTTEQVSNVSGRGVGMDIVQKTIKDLDGQISIESQKDIGTRFIISLPLTLAITKALMVKIAKDSFAIPLNTIDETIMITNEDIQKVRQQDVITLRDNTIPLIDSRDILSIKSQGNYKEREKIAIVIIKSGEKLIGLVVDELLDQQEIVIKSLDNYLAGLKYISGATIIGDGDVALILDLRNIA